MTTAETVVIPTPDGPAPATLTEPDGPARGGVVVLHEAFGLTEHITDVCSRFARAGWRAIAPDLFHRAGSPVFDYDDLASAVKILDELNGTDLLADIDAALAILAEEGTAIDRCAVVGFCVGGSIAFQAAVARPFGAASTFYGGGITMRRFGEPAQLDLADRLQAPWLGLYGDQDPSILASEVEDLRAATRKASVPAEIVRYPQAGHGFHNDARAGAYHGPSAKDAWSRMLTWFDSHVPG
ncbi:carboxymethylenebutenolidase [Frankia sp. CcI156]|uniref:Carboxymethylenebutenolidase n=1 Tax=Frankia casuarinae (strain DSM 45818 / CECT 9043 / HFP020203 / CcI3) TaxID=106370 RepID=Q2JFM2_FRACC|nr:MULTISPECIES: dienelactone hydrolase family protein [Frankia]ABD09920.1 Carboxymethylenebutenolidase [Frankia casuarinae]ETA04371.1 dienelactone hydrolase-like enzyme [Frankia sp. CcI6]EYT89857.1 dienelactone hydrolase-like enzyme [Frankia casuarinae]KDA44931.1 dienelactone hydrolase-like enzyme [Frankia sp. BMG5.23]KFB06582.1 dienelactone hydrolase-like enzyme [Frankia sp. Allo2]